MVKMITVTSHVVAENGMGRQYICSWIPLSIIWINSGIRLMQPSGSSSEAASLTLFE